MNHSNIYFSKIEKGNLFHLGIHRQMQDISIVVELHSSNEQGIIIFLPNGEEFKIPFAETMRIGNLFCVILKDFSLTHFQYMFYEDSVLVADAYARQLTGSNKFGIFNNKSEITRCVYDEDTFNWENDKALEIPFDESIIYKLHVRGFTKHKSSKVLEKGTFKGVESKISYLKDLGITAIEAMPIYEFKEIIYNPAFVKMDEKLKPFLAVGQETWEKKTNYWGFADANYFAPKYSYSYSDNPVRECKEMIKALHEQGIEFIMKLYFEPSVNPVFMLEVCRFWVVNYHVDGFRIMSGNLSYECFLSDPYLSRTKLLFDNQINDYALQFRNKDFKNIALASSDFMYDMRKYMKSDEDMIAKVTYLLKKNPNEYACINEITKYEGFTLQDVVSFDRKHNEQNEEDNRDGNDYNYSWNCGYEGNTRRKAVVMLRKKQVKNAFILLLSAQGTPAIMSGDEFGHSAKGNNNPYCQDNNINWLNWDLIDTNKDLFDFVKDLICFRKKFKILHMANELRQIDYLSSGFPDVSYHGEQAWYPEFQNYNRHFGILYSNLYSTAKIEEDQYLYFAFNSHWQPHAFLLPKLPAQYKWKILIKTDVNVETNLEIDLKAKQNKVMVPPRAIIVLIGE